MVQLPHQIVLKQSSNDDDLAPYNTQKIVLPEISTVMHHFFANLGKSILVFFRE